MRWGSFFSRGTFCKNKNKQNKHTAYADRHTDNYTYTLSQLLKTFASVIAKIQPLKRSNEIREYNFMFYFLELIPFVCSIVFEPTFVHIEQEVQLRSRSSVILSASNRM